MKYILTYGIVLLLFSCRASRENKKSEKESSDSTRVATFDSSSIKRNDSLNVTQHDITEESTVEATLEFEIEDSAGNVKDTVIVVKAPVSAGWLDVALSKPNLKSIHYKEKKKKQDNSKSTTLTNFVDSSGKKTSDTTHVGTAKQINNDTIDVKQWSFWGLFPWYVWLIISVIAVGLLWWKLPFLFKRKKTKNENTV